MPEDPQALCVPAGKASTLHHHLIGAGHLQVVMKYKALSW